LSFGLLEERCLSTRHGERHLERHCLGHIFLVRGLGDVGERAPDGQLDSGGLATTDRPESAS